MTDSDSMAESSNLMLKARDVLATPTHDELENVLDRFSMPQETTEFQTGRALFVFCAENFPNCLTLKLLNVYRFSSNEDIRFLSIYVLSEALAQFRNHKSELSLVGLKEIKPLVISCLLMQETDESVMDTLGRIVSTVAYNVFMLDNGEWDELRECILQLANSEPLNAFLVLVDLPPLYESFILRVMQNILKEAEKVLFNPEEDRVKDWSLNFKTVVKMVIQLLRLEVKRPKWVTNLLSLLVESASKLVEKGMEQLLLQGLEDLESFLTRDMSLYNYNGKQCFFVSLFMLKVWQLGKHTKKAAKKINLLVKSLQPQEKPQDHGTGSERGWFDYLNTLSPLENVRIFASSDFDEEARDMALRRLNLLLADHTSKKVGIDIPVMRQLQPLLISRLKEDGLSVSMFKVLGEVVFHVANEMISYQKDKWLHLWDYIGSQCKTQFERAVYIFKSLTMKLGENDFVFPVIDKLLPEINTRLNPPRELLIDNSSWVLAFVGAFCAAIHLIDITSHADSVKEITNKMIDSVRELVERGMEVGLLRRAVRDLENTVKKQVKWYSKSEYRFVKGLLWRLYAIKAMKMESRMVLWRINVIVERGVNNLLKE